MASTFSDDVMAQWVGRLQLGPDEVESLVGQQPALMEMAPTTVKARLVGADGAQAQPASALICVHD
jgi:hypothetical protein